MMDKIFKALETTIFRILGVFKFDQKTTGPRRYSIAFSTMSQYKVTDMSRISTMLGKILSGVIPYKVLLRGCDSMIFLLDFVFINLSILSIYQ